MGCHAQGLGAREGRSPSSAVHVAEASCTAILVSHKRAPGCWPITMLGMHAGHGWAWLYGMTTAKLAAKHACWLLRMDDLY